MSDDKKFVVCRDKIGNASFMMMDKSRVPTWIEISKPRLRELKRLRDWLTRLIDWVERR